MKDKQVRKLSFWIYFPGFFYFWYHENSKLWKVYVVYKLILVRSIMFYHSNVFWFVELLLWTKDVHDMEGLVGSCVNLSCASTVIWSGDVIRQTESMTGKDASWILTSAVIIFTMQTGKILQIMNKHEWVFDYITSFVALLLDVL